MSFAQTDNLDSKNTGNCSVAWKVLLYAYLLQPYLYMQITTVEHAAKTGRFSVSVPPLLPNHCYLASLPHLLHSPLLPVGCVAAAPPNPGNAWVTKLQPQHHCQEEEQCIVKAVNHLFCFFAAFNCPLNQFWLFPMSVREEMPSVCSTSTYSSRIGSVECPLGKNSPDGVQITNGRW